MSARQIISALLAAVMAVTLIWTLLRLDTEGPPAARVSEHYLEHGRTETGAVNIVAAVLLDYRGFDTLGETVVILAAALAVGMLLGQGRLPGSERGLSVLVRRSIGFLAPLFWLLPAYIVVNGHLSPGGGFQGGVGWATLFILATVVYGSRRSVNILPPDLLPKIEYGAALCFVGIGLYGLIRAGFFLSNQAAGFPMGQPGSLFSAGVLPWLNLVIGCKGMAAMAAIFFHLQREENPSP